MTTSEHRGFAAALALALIVCAAPAIADTADEQRAVSLFEKGRKLARDGRCADAVTPLLESIRYAEGVGALLNLGHCYENLGKTASAHRYFVRAREVASAKNDPRGDEADQRARSLEKDVPTLIVHVATALRASADVHVDGELWARDRWDTPIPVDPGSHTVEIHAPPAPADSSTVNVAKGEHIGVESTAAPASAAAAAVTPAAQKPGATEPAAVANEKSPLQSPSVFARAPTRQRTAAFIVGGTGAAALIAGGIFGVVSIVDHGNAIGACPGYPSCTSTSSVNIPNSAALTAGTLSTIFFAAGLALLAGGTTLFFTSERAHVSPNAPGRTGTRTP